MLTAQKENNQLKTRPVAQGPSTVRSFDRVVNSIDGLRERIQGYTLEEVSEIEERLRAMSTRLSELRQTLTVLSEMKLQISQLQYIVQQAAVESLEQNRLVTRVEPIPAQAITQFVNLLKFRQVISILKSANTAAGVSTSINAQPQQPVPMEHAEVIAEHQKHEEEFGADLQLIQPELPAISNKDTVVGGADALEEPKVLIHSASTAMDFEPNEPFLNESTDAIFLDDSTGNNHAPEIDGQFADTRDQLPPSHVIAEAEEPTIVKPNAAEETDFDHRLLDDLIKNYGEIYVSPSSSEKTEVSPEPKQEIITSTPQAAPLTTVNATSQRNLPLQRENGDLDRKLKKLIKDYGEYDLYSRQSPIKLKTGVVIAFLLMTLIFSGFYFFSSSKSSVSSTASSASQPQSSSNAPTKETSKIADTSGTENPSAPSVSNIDVPKTAEADASPHLSNKVAPKKTR
jgi:hypothetical protein